MISESEVEVTYGLFSRNVQISVRSWFLFSCYHFTELINRNKVFTTNYALSVNEYCEIKLEFVDE